MGNMKGVHQQKPGGRESGQVAVESAIVLPLFVFLILGTLQLGLMHQARLITKYAAYKAVRAGSLNNAQTSVMERAAISVLLPIISKDSGGGEFIKTINNATDFQSKWNWPGVKANAMPDTGIPYVEVTTCGPSTKEVGGNELDFDDPRFAASMSWQASHRTKLRIQVTFNYRMPIPFANWVIHAAAFNREIPWLMRMGEKSSKAAGNFGPQNSKYISAASNGKYVLPIRAAYTMRMQSNVFVNQLPSSNQCRTTNKY
ncbi:TadE/TadG family type IV pilus assembly protein [Archangium lansingense]|uniref:Pilus assembly protein n=1 Tax=Archangium lansingense TaxID=2995310 RepID=A0ABT4AH64_9BACT|nr:TadE family protein [Archangium lansinium]MCY1081013.1 pilus assembly protein [Archangium lansinium]